MPMPEYYHHIVTGRMPTYTAYEIRVKSKNEEGEAVTPNTVIGYTGEDGEIFYIPRYIILTVLFMRPLITKSLGRRNAFVICGHSL